MRIIQTIKCRLINLLNERIKRTNWYKNQLVDKELYPTNEWYRSHSERNFNIVNIGSSSAITAFNYKYSNLKGLTGLESLNRWNWASKFSKIFQHPRAQRDALHPFVPIHGAYSPMDGHKGGIQILWCT